MQMHGPLQSILGGFRLSTRFLTGNPGSIQHRTKSMARTKMHKPKKVKAAKKVKGKKRADNEVVDIAAATIGGEVVRSDFPMET